jgi:hypothetical protein
MSDGRRIADHEGKRRRAFLFRQLYQWHWISSGLCLIGMLVFAITGITLNHAGQIESAPRVQSRDAQLPPSLLSALAAQPAGGKAALPAEIGDWLRRELGVAAGGRDTEWSAKEIYVALPRPGGDAWLSIDRGDGAVTYEVTSRGWIAYLNDLHKGRHTGTAWSWFIDLFAGAAIVFCLTGLLLLQLHAPRRPSTWPVVGLGFVLPMLVLVLFIHR